MYFKFNNSIVNIILIASCLISTLAYPSSIYASSPGSHKGKYIQIDLSNYPNWNNYFIALPTGNTTFDSLPFYLRETDPAFISTGLVSSNWTGGITIQASVRKAKKVNMLINGGSMYLYSLNTEAGYLRFVGTQKTLVVPLIAGVNIREWSPADYNNVVNTLTDHNAKEVWSGTWQGWTTVPARIDLYSINLPKNFGDLLSVEMYDTSSSTALNLYAITVEAK